MDPFRFTADSLCVAWSGSCALLPTAVLAVRRKTGEIIFGSTLFIHGFLDRSIVVTNGVL